MGTRSSNLGLQNVCLQFLIVSIHFTSNRHILKLLDLANLTGLQPAHLSPATLLPVPQRNSSIVCLRRRYGLLRPLHRMVRSPLAPPLQVARSAGPSSPGEFSTLLALPSTLFMIWWHGPSFVSPSRRHFPPHHRVSWPSVASHIGGAPHHAGSSSVPLR